MKIWGIHKKYKALSWWENFMSGHVSIGPLVIFGCNAMNWTVNYRTKKWGAICFTLPTWDRIALFIFNAKGNGRHLEWYLYLSPNGTPWASTYYIGSDKQEQIRARIRKMNFGHGFSTNKNRYLLRCLNEKFEWFEISDYDMTKFGYAEEIGDYKKLKTS